MLDAAEDERRRWYFYTRAVTLQALAQHLTDQGMLEYLFWHVAECGMTENTNGEVALPALSILAGIAPKLRGEAQIEALRKLFLGNDLVFDWGLKVIDDDVMKKTVRTCLLEGSLVGGREPILELLMHQMQLAIRSTEPRTQRSSASVAREILLDLMKHHLSIHEIVYVLTRFRVILREPVPVPLEEPVF